MIINSMYHSGPDLRLRRLKSLLIHESINRSIIPDVTKAARQMAKKSNDTFDILQLSGSD